MFIYCNLAVLIGALLDLTFRGQVHAGEIVGGNESVPHSRPYMVLVESTTDEDKPHHCGGFLVSENFVMTAAHCQAKSYNVLIGFHCYFEKNKTNLSVDKAFPHKDYNENEFLNDVMLLKLSTNVSFNEKQKPIAMADQKDKMPKSCIVIGWGKTTRDNENAPMSAKLLEVNVTLTKNALCDDKCEYCSEGERGAAKGDSGGPLVCEDGKAFGVVSAGSKLDSGSWVNKYMKISHYSEWIEDIMKHK